MVLKVTIKTALNGWKVKFFPHHAELLFIDKGEMLNALTIYINDPEAMEKVIQESINYKHLQPWVKEGGYEPLSFADFDEDHESDE